MPEPAPPAVELRLPADAATSVPRFWSRLAIVGFVLAVLCLPIAAAALVTDQPALIAVGLAGAVVWGGLGALARWYAVRSPDARSGFGAGRVLIGVHADDLVLDGRPLPAAAVGGLELHWFSLADPRALTPGAALGRAMVRAAQDDAGGNLGLAVVAHPRDGSAAAVGKAHRMLVDGDLLAASAAVAAFAQRHGVRLAGSPTPPPSAPPLPDQLRG